MLVESLQRPATTRVTPKMFTYNIKTTCAARPQHIVLPEGLDKRILAAGAEVSQRGLAKVTLLGDPELVNAGGWSAQAGGQSCGALCCGLSLLVHTTCAAPSCRNAIPDAVLTSPPLRYTHRGQEAGPGHLRLQGGKPQGQ
jgi:hypothetical protein